MNWFKKRTTSGRKKKSSTKRRSSSTKRKTVKRRVSSNKKDSRVCFVKGQPRVAKPKQNSSGYYYTRRTPTGQTQKVTVTGRTFTKAQALAKMKARK